MPITALNHITLAVTDLEKSFKFYRDILGLRPLVKWDQGAYFLVGDENSGFWLCLNTDKNSTTSAGYTHYAFSVQPQQFTQISQHIINSGAKIFKENTSPGNSLYFLDPDGHKLEIHTGNWRERIEAKKINPKNWRKVKWFV